MRLTSDMMLIAMLQQYAEGCLRLCLYKTTLQPEFRNQRPRDGAPRGCASASSETFPPRLLYRCQPGCRPTASTVELQSKTRPGGKETPDKADACLSAPHSHYTGRKNLFTSIHPAVRPTRHDSALIVAFMMALSAKPLSTVMEASEQRRMPDE